MTRETLDRLYSPTEKLKLALVEDEAIIWSSFDMKTQIRLRPKPDFKLMGYVFRYIWIFYALFWAFHIWYTRDLYTREYISEMLVFFIVGIVALLVFLFFLKVWRKKLENTKFDTEPFIFCAITDKRVLLFNHDRMPPITLSYSKISDTRLDYHNGGICMKITPTGTDKSYCLVGMHDFKTAISHIDEQMP